MSKNIPAKTREKWSHNVDFMFNIAGASVGLGNIWRFPYLCYKNGGGAFLIPYLITLFTTALPIFFLEATLGQYTSRAVSKAWGIVPVMKGIGLASTVILWNLNTYYMPILVWAMRYMVACLQSELPWSTCNNDWNSQDCFVFGTTANDVTATNVTTNNTSNATRVSSVYEYWDKGVLGRSSGLGEVGSIQWPLFWCLFFGCFIVYLCIWKGIAWTSKIVYFTATFPLFMLLILLVRGVTLDGASIGIYYYLVPNITKLSEPEVWMDATTQVFYSYSICSGIVVALGSYNTFNHNVYRDTLYFAILNSGTSFVSGFAVFSVLGFMAKQENVSISDVTDSGPGLVFQAYPRAVAMLPFPQLWGVLFFLMLFFLGLDSQFVGQESLIASFRDMAPSAFNKKWRREIIIGIVCFVQFLIGITMITQGGIYVFAIYDYSAAGWCLFFNGITECLTISWLYGAEKFNNNTGKMLGYKPRLPWYKYGWMFTAPLFSTAVFVYSLVTYKPLTYAKTYTFPVGGQILVWVISLSAILWIPGYAIYCMATAKGENILEKWREVSKPCKKLEERIASSRDEIKRDKHVGMNEIEMEWLKTTKDSL